MCCWGFLVWFCWCEFFFKLDLIFLFNFSEVTCTLGLRILTLGGLWQEQAGTWEPQMTSQRQRLRAVLQTDFGSCCSCCGMCLKLRRPQIVGAVRGNGEKLHQCSGCSIVQAARIRSSYHRLLDPRRRQLRVANYHLGEAAGD